MSVIESLQTYLKTYTGLTGQNVFVNNLEGTPITYSIVPLPGEQVVEEYIAGGRTMIYPFALQSMRFTNTNDLERIQNSSFFEDFGVWLRSQSESGVLPSLPSGKTAEKIEAVTGGVLFEQGDSGTGIYQIQCLLTYYE